MIDSSVTSYLCQTSVPLGKSSLFCGNRKIQQYTIISLVPGDMSKSLSGCLGLQLVLTCHASYQVLSCVCVVRLYIYIRLRKRLTVIDE